jgi:hypothetical protein
MFIEVLEKTSTEQAIFEKNREEYEKKFKELKEISEQILNQKKTITIMKKQVLFLAALTCMMVHSVSALANDRIIPVNQLPEAAQKFVKATFPGQTISYATVDMDFGSKTYEVRLDNCVEIEFDKNGTWDKVDCNYIAVPSDLVPVAIAEYVKTNFAGTKIVKIDKEHGGYEVELSNDIELHFNSQGKLMYFDD